MIEKIKVILKGKFWWVPFLVLLIFFSTLRFANINADAPQDLSISAALYTDEGFKTYSTRNFKHYGSEKWSPLDGYRNWHTRALVPSTVYLGWFKLFGVSFASMRTPTILLSIFSMILLFFGVRRFYDIYTAYAAFILFGCNHVIIMYSRLAFYENFLVFFSLLAFVAFGEFFRRLHRVRFRADELKLNVPKEIIFTCLFLFLGITAMVGGYLSKESMNIIIFSLLPFAILYFFYSRFHMTAFVVHVAYFIIIVIFIGYMIAGHSTLFDEFFKKINSLPILGTTIGNLIPLKTNVGNFDPIYLTFAKSLFLEFVYNQPLTFFTGIFFALLCFYRFLYQSKCNAMDMALSSWLLFCFAFLSMMKYHPARYYLLVSIPLIILSARFIVGRDYMNLVALTKRLKVQSFLIITSLFWFYFVFYAGIVFFVSTTPFSFRKKLYDFVYSCIEKGKLDDVFPIAFLIILVQIFFFILIVPKIRPLKNNLEKKRFFTVIFLLIITFDLFLYGKWVFTSNYKLHDLSVKLGETLPPNSILVGGWAAGLTIENRLRSIVIQGEMNYNTGFVDIILKGKKIPVVKKKDDITVRTYESKMPVYLLVSSNAPFEKKMSNTYSRFITDRRRVVSTELGYFNVDMYRLDKLPGSEKNKFKNFK